MHRSRFHPAIAWLCLIWFGLTSTLLSGGMVVCQDGHGGSRVEWGCDRNIGGECLTSCGGETGDDPGDSHPCQDTPLDAGEQVSKAPPRSTSVLTIPVPVMAALVLGLDPPTPARVGWTSSAIERPPDALKRIRTVVLLV